MERGNLARAVKVPGAGRLLEDNIERKDRCGTARCRVRQLLETDALGAKIGVGELFLRRQRLARVGDAVREPGLLRGKQQQSQQTEKDASQFHVVMEGTPRSVALWPANVRSQVMRRLQCTNEVNRTPEG